MDKSFLLSQYQILKRILKENARTRTHQSFDLGHLLYEDDLDLIHLHLSENIPVFDYESYMLHLKRLVDMPTSADDVILAGKNVISPKRASFLYQFKKEVYPLTADYYKNFFKPTMKKLSAAILHSPKGSKGTFYMLDETLMSEVYGIQKGELMSLMLDRISYFDKKNVFPKKGDMAHIGKSHYQKTHAYLEMLKRYGHQISLLIVRADLLEDVLHLYAQKERRHTSIKEICPNLKVVAYLEGCPYLERQNIDIFLTEDIQTTDFFLEPHELLGIQASSMEKGIVMVEDAGEIFYSFIHESDLHANGLPKNDHVRLHYGEIKLGESYLPLVSNVSGFLMHQNYKIFKVESLAPFKMRFVRDSRILNHFNERLSTAQMDASVNKINLRKESYGFSIRKYLVGDNTYTTQMHWLFEIDTNVKNVQQALFQSVASTLHTELMLMNAQFKDGVASNKVPTPKITFVSVGAFSLYVPEMDWIRIDLSDSAEIVEKILSATTEKVSVLPVDQYSSNLSIENFE